MVFLSNDVFSEGFTHFINMFLIFSVLWALLNLLPIYPLDGGQIARVIFLQSNRYNGLRYSLTLSLAVAILMAVVSLLYWQSYFTRSPRRKGECVHYIESRRKKGVLNEKTE